MKMYRRSPVLVALCLAPLWVATACGQNADQVGLDAAAGAGGNPDSAAGGNGGSTPIDAPEGDDIIIDAGSPEPEPEPDLPPSACPVYTPVRLSNALGASEQPAILWTGVNYLVVWSDSRQNNGSADIYGTFLDFEGNRVGGADSDFIIADSAAIATSPEVTALPDKSGYVVVYEVCEGGPTCANGNSVASILLGADGRPTGDIRSLTEAAPVQRRPYLATGNGKIYVTYRDRTMAANGVPAKTMARLTELTPTGALKGPGLLLDPDSNGAYPHVATSDDHVALVYERDKPNPDIVLALFTPDLVFQRELVLRTGLDTDATNPVVGWNGHRWIVAWEDQRDGEAAIYATSASADATQGATAVRVYDENGNWPAIASSGAATGTTSVIGFYGYPGQRTWLARIDESGNLQMGLVRIGIGKYPAVVYTPEKSEYAVVYEDPQLQEIFFARFKCVD